MPSLDELPTLGGLLVRVGRVCCGTGWKPILRVAIGDTEAISL